ASKFCTGLDRCQPRGFLLVAVLSGGHRTEPSRKKTRCRLVISAVPAPHPVQMASPGPSPHTGGPGRFQNKAIRKYSPLPVPIAGARLPGLILIFAGGGPSHPGPAAPDP